jgi:hypothetical protein
MARVKILRAIAQCEAAKFHVTATLLREVLNRHTKKETK